MTLGTRLAPADVIAFTSFENKPVFGPLHIDTGNPSVDHDLANNADQSLVRPAWDLMRLIATLRMAGLASPTAMQLESRISHPSPRRACLRLRAETKVI